MDEGGPRRGIGERAGFESSTWINQGKAINQIILRVYTGSRPPAVAKWGPAPASSATQRGKPPDRQPGPAGSQ